ncbi:hypothetical protein MYO4S_00092 [Serratia phage 4S]|nr:hypothetical protein MYO4S_00092 [Serratia phage 4S]
MINALTFSMTDRVKAKETVGWGDHTYMTVEQAHKIMAELFAKHNMQGWKFEIISSRSKRNIAMCWHGRKLITFQDRYFFAMTWNQVMDTLLHELAHGIAGYSAGHGPEWRKVCMELGCTPRAMTNLRADPGFRQDWIIPVGTKYTELQNTDGEFKPKPKREHKPTKAAVKVWNDVQARFGLVSVFGFCQEFENQTGKNWGYGEVQYKLCKKFYG